MSEPRVQLAAIAVHPVKSTAVRPVREAAVEPWGLAGDRRWMVVGPDGECLTAREHRRLLGVVADTPDTTALDAALRLTAPGMPDLHVEEPHGARVPVTVHGRGLHAVVAPAEAGAWVGQVVGVNGLRLVHVARPRPLNPAHSLPGDATAFADAYPVTLVTAASLRQLDEWVAQTARERGEEPPLALEVSRFRPNLLIEGDLEPFEEDHWRRVRVGDVEFRVAKPVDRCVMTTIDPRTREGGHEPIRTLARHRKWEGATWFAVQLVPDVPGRIAVGDEVAPRR
ncbi:MAG: MOSC N-terminal beta barrel domain-containing protein [Ornithinibacter sp.]